MSRFSDRARPMSTLAPSDRHLLDVPLPALCLFSFVGEGAYGELSYEKGQRILVFCEDMTEGWSLGMLVDEQGRELDLGEGKDGDEILTRGLIARGFYEYIPNDETTSSTGPSESSSKHTNGKLEATSSHTPHMSRELSDFLADADRSNGGQDQHTMQTEERLEYAKGDDSTQPEDCSVPVPASPTIIQPAPLDDPPASVSVIETGPLEVGVEHIVPVELLESDSVSRNQPPLITLAAYHQTAQSEHLAKPAGQASPTSSTSALSHLIPVPPAPRPVRARQSSLKYNRPRNVVEAYLSSAQPQDTQQPSPGEAYEVADGDWVARVPSFTVSVPSYAHRDAASGTSEHTVFQLVASVPLPSPASPSPDDEKPRTASRRIVVHRRYNHFQHLHTILRASFPLISIPDLPEKRITGRFTKEFLDGRRRDLERYLRRVTRHALVRSSRALLDFLGNEDERAFEKSLHRALFRATSLESYNFFTRVSHDADYFDLAEYAGDVAEDFWKFAIHVEAVEKGDGGSAVQDGLSGYRSGIQSTGHALQTFSRAMYKLIAGLAQPPDPLPSIDTSAESADSTRCLRDRAKAYHMQNEDGAFCWRDGCDECLGTTKAVQATAEALHTISGLYEANAQTVLLPPTELLVEYSQPHKRHKVGHRRGGLADSPKDAIQALVTMQQSAQQQLKAVEKLDDRSKEDDELAARCECVLNAVSAELSALHSQRRTDLSKITTGFLDGQIAFHEHALAQLKAARANFHPLLLETLVEQGPRMPSRLEKAALNTSLATIQPLRTPSFFGLPPTSTSHLSRPGSILGNIVVGTAGSILGWRSASSAIRAQQASQDADETEALDKTVGSPSLAASRFVQFLDWTMNSRGEQRKHAA